MKIFVTISRIKDDYDLSKLAHIIKKLSYMKIDGIRVNFAKLNPDEMLDYISKLIDIVMCYSNRFEFLFDMPYPMEKTRIINHNVDNDIIVKGKCYSIISDSTKFCSKNESIIISRGNTNYYNIGDKIIYGDGEVAFQVINNIPNFLEVVALNDFKLLKNKSLSCGFYYCTYSNAIFEVCNRIAALELNFNFLLSFVESEEYLKEFRKNVPKSKNRIISKIETQKGVEMIESISAYSSGIVLARGDLGIYGDLIMLLNNSQIIADYCMNNGVRILVATDILKSMCERAVPNRADLLDLSTLSMLGYDQFILSHEFSSSKNIEFVIKLINDINVIYFKDK